MDKPACVHMSVNDALTEPDTTRDFPPVLISTCVGYPKYITREWSRGVYASEEKLHNTRNIRPEQQGGVHEKY